MMRESCRELSADLNSDKISKLPHYHRPATKSNSRCVAGKRFSYFAIWPWEGCYFQWVLASNNASGLVRVHTLSQADCDEQVICLIGCVQRRNSKRMQQPVQLSSIFKSALARKARLVMISLSATDGQNDV
eukprot:scaffold89077_cov38-Prasinocladus_malaysianus.AAC.1